MVVDLKLCEMPILCGGVRSGGRFFVFLCCFFILIVSIVRWPSRVLGLFWFSGIIRGFEFVSQFYFRGCIGLVTFVGPVHQHL